MREGTSSGTATVLFTDLVGSTDLLTQLGEDAFDEFRRSHFAAVDELTTLTPSGLVLSIGSQPSREVMGSIRVPVLMVLSEKDTLFPVEHGAKELALFAGASDKELQVVPLAGHSFQLEPNAPESFAHMVEWLRQHAAALPPCSA